MTANQTRAKPLPTIEPLGDCGWLMHWPDERMAAHWAELVRNWKSPEITEVVAAYRTVGVICRTGITDDPWNALLARIHESMAMCELSSAFENLPDKPVIKIPVIYDGPDLNHVAQVLGLSESAVVQAHTRQSYRVYAVGFLPGFPYAGYLPQILSGLPRRSRPRVRVPAGSVAIVGRQTGIYPCQSPGGWHLLGRTEMTICDLHCGFFRFRPGDRIQFVASEGGVIPKNLDSET